MIKLVKGILDFRKNVRPKYFETFAKLALGQFPDTLFVACSDSRVAPNVFASTDPGDMFVIRNVGNIIPACGGEHGRSTSDESEAAAIEFAIVNLGISDIIVCGHSECGAMHALLNGRYKINTPNLRSWLRHGEKALSRLRISPDFATEHADHNRLSQLNVLQQIENLQSYPIVFEHLDVGRLRIHGWWFELSKAAVHAYDRGSGKFVELDEEVAKVIIEAMSPGEK